MNTPDYYALLRVRRNATPDQIRCAYHRQARHYHPDAHPNRQNAPSAPTMAMINQAYDVLSDPQARTAYDRTRQAELARVRPTNIRRRRWRMIITVALGGTVGLLIATLLGWLQLPAADWPVQGAASERWVWPLVLLGASIILLALRQLATW